LFGVLPKDSIIPPRIAQMGHAYGANFELMYGFRSVGGYEISLERLKKFLSDLSPDEMDLIMFTTKGVLETRDRRIDMLSAKYYIVSEWDPRYLEFRKQPERFRFLHTFTDTDVYENLRALPPAWLVPASGIEAIADEERQLSRLKDPNFDAEHCVVMAEAPKDLPASPAAAAGVAGAAKVEWTRWSVNAFEVDVNAPEPSVLVISQTEYPGWKAWIDGKPAALTRANYVFPAIFVPPGSHHVRFSFEPSSFKAGLALSLLATAILGVMVFRSGSDRSNPNRV
jgi:hypothetical protein